MKHSVVIVLILSGAIGCSSDLFVTSVGAVDDANDLLLEGKHAAALEAYNKLQSRNPRIAFDRGLALYHLKQWDAAVGAFDEVREAKDQGMKAMSYFHIGNVHARKALDAEAAGLAEDAKAAWEAAVAAYENCLLIDPDHADAKHQLEIALFRVDPPCSLRNDPLEPNNAFGEARLAELAPIQEEDASPGEKGLEQTLWLCPDDEDWLIVPLEPGDRFSAEATRSEGPDHAKAAVEIWAADGKSRVMPEQGAETTQKVELGPVTTAGEYRIRLDNPGDDDFGLKLALKVRPACLRTEDQYEPNDSQPQAKVVEAGEVKPLRMCPGAHDWYGIQLAEGESLKVTADIKAQSGALEIQLVDAQGTVLGDGAKEEDKVVALAYARPAGPVWIHVSGTDDAEAVYSLNLEKIPVCAEREDDYEDNDDVVGARDLPGGDHEGLQLCPGDPDVFRVQVKPGESIVAHLSTEEVLIGSPQVEVLDGTGKSMVGGFNLGGGRLAQAIDPGEGTYYVRVADEENRPADAKYTLRIQILPACPEGNDAEESNDVAADAKTLDLPEKAAPGGAPGQPGQPGAGGPPPPPKQKLLRVCPGDIDWFRIPVTPETPLISASIEFIHDKGDLRLVEYEADGETRVAESDKSTEQTNAEQVVVPPPETRVPEPTDFLLKIDGIDAKTQNFYLLSLREVPPSGDDQSQNQDQNQDQQDQENEDKQEQQQQEPQERPDRSTLEKEMESEDKNPRNLEAERARDKARHLPPPLKDW